MYSYRMYFVDDENHFTGVAIIDADNDNQALSYARQNDDAQHKELWCGARKVGFVAARDAG